MSLKSVFVALFIIGIDGCKLSIHRDISDPQPLILYKRGHNKIFYEPNDNGDITVPSSDEIYVACPGVSVTLNGFNTGTTSVMAECDSGSTFIVNKQKLNFAAIKCSRQIEQIVRYTGKGCLSQYREFEMGYQLDDGRFLQLIVGCFDANAQRSVYTMVTVTRAIGGYQSGYGRIDFKQPAGFYNLGGVTVDSLYARDEQRKTINAQLGLPANDYRYIHKTNDYYLARGHYTAKTDFLYGVQQRLTFFFVNAAPQWQTINGGAGNWFALEKNVRDYASRNQVNLVVYTGTCGILQIAHMQTRRPVQLWLHKGATNAIPIPSIFWKVVYNPVTQMGTAFLVKNNPYSYGFNLACANVSSQISWLTWHASNKKSGFASACHVDAFRRICPVLPHFPVNGLLT